MFVPWLDFWRDFFVKRPAPTCPSKLCTLDDLSTALADYLESARDVAAGAAKNVEDAKQLLRALEARGVVAGAAKNVEDAERLLRALEDFKERKRQAQSFE